MTNLSTEAKAELQRMIDIGATYMRAQGCCSVSTDDEGYHACNYRGDDGSKCFIGALIADEHYHSDLEGQTVAFLSVNRALEASGYSIYVNSLSGALGSAQRRLHDYLEHSNTFLPDFEEALVSYCSEYGLDYTAHGEML
jgi:hypothetical protein